MRTTKRKPTSPGEILSEEFLKPLHITQAELARHLGCDVKVINRLVNEQTNLTADMAVQLGAALNTTSELDEPADGDESLRGRGSGATPESAEESACLRLTLSFLKPWSRVKRQLNRNFALLIALAHLLKRPATQNCFARFVSLLYVVALGSWRSFTVVPTSNLKSSVQSVVERLSPHPYCHSDHRYHRSRKHRPDGDAAHPANSS